MIVAHSCVLALVLQEQRCCAAFCFWGVIHGIAAVVVDEVCSIMHSEVQGRHERPPALGFVLVLLAQHAWNTFPADALALDPVKTKKNR